MHIEPAHLNATRIAATPVASSRARLVAAAFLLGAGLLSLAGFAQLPSAHNAAHDTRHSAAFPCH